jgi:hypothetical protein
VGGRKDGVWPPTSLFSESTCSPAHSSLLIQIKKKEQALLQPLSLLLTPENKAAMEAWWSISECVLGQEWERMWAHGDSNVYTLNPNCRKVE